MLLEHGADLHHVNNRGQTILHVAGTYFIFLINSVNSNNRKQQPAENNQYDMVDDLIEHGADLKCFDRDNRNVLHIAAQDGSFRVVEVLIRRGADVNAVDDENNTALILALAEKDRCRADNREEYIKVVNMLIESGADVNAFNKGGATPIHFAAALGPVALVNVLIQNGADVNAVTKKKKAAIHLAAEQQHADIAKFLIENGADVNAVEQNKRTALHISEKGVDVAKVWIQTGVDVNAVDKKKRHFTSQLEWTGSWRNSDSERCRRGSLQRNRQHTLQLKRDMLTLKI